MKLTKPDRLDLAAAGLKVTELLARQLRLLRDRGEAALERSPLRPRAREALTRYREAARAARERLGRPSTPSARLRAAIETGGKLQPDWLPAGCVLLPVDVASVMCAGTDGFLRGMQPTHDFQRALFDGSRDQAIECLRAARDHRPTTALVPLELLQAVWELARLGLDELDERMGMDCDERRQVTQASDNMVALHKLLQAAGVPCAT